MAHIHNADELRSKIDRGGTGDKVDYPDPAAAPLGTDDEAAGHPLTPQQLAMDVSASSTGHQGKKAAFGLWIFCLASGAFAFAAVVAIILAR
jgi:hypothetical protein